MKILKLKHKEKVYEALQFNNINYKEVEEFVGVPVKVEEESTTAYEAGMAPPLFTLRFQINNIHFKIKTNDFILKDPEGNLSLIPQQKVKDQYDDITTFKDRMQLELAELCDKLYKLNSFIISDKFKELPIEDRNDLEIQAFYMKKYSNILAKRIQRALI